MTAHQKTLCIPESSYPIIREGKHKIEQLQIRQYVVEAEIGDSDISGYWDVESELTGKLENILLKKPRSRSQHSNQSNVLKMKKSTGLANVSEDTSLSWVANNFLAAPPTPDTTTKSWRNLLQFNEENRDDGTKGLRAPQIGALHAIAAHCSLPPREPATVVLPTGTGKTDTMIASLVYLRCPRLLVIVPSRVLRKQIADKFRDLGVLPEVGVVPSDICFPSVCALSSGLKSIDEARVVAEAALVVVSTVNALNEATADVRECFLSSFSHLFIDEAHHVASNTWSSLRDSFSDRHIVQFTATPFRNDGKSLGGRVIYNFTMGDAQRADYFRHIRLIPIEEYYQDDHDRAIAQRALEVLREDLANGHDHVLMARVEKISRSAEVLPIYQDLADDLLPVVVHNRMTLIRTRISD